MSSQPPSRSRQRRQRYSGITQPLAPESWDEAPAAPPAPEAPAEPGVREVAPLEPNPVPASAALEEWQVAAVPGPAPAADRSELLAQSQAHTREARRAGQMLEQVTPAEPWSVGEKNRFLLLAGLVAVVAGVGGYLLGQLTAVGAGARTVDSEPKSGRPQIAEALNPEQIRAETSAAFTSMKERRFGEARTKFAALAARSPHLFPLGLEVARAYLYEGAFLDAQQALQPYFQDSRTAGEAHFILGLVQMTERKFLDAVGTFQKSIEAAPTRGDAHYMLAEAMRRAGKSEGASQHYQAALARNQVETNELTYRLKLWISQVQDGTLSEARRAELATAVQKPELGSEPLVVDAAVLLKAGDFAGCARRLTEAGRMMEPLLFKVVLFDPFFSQESWRPELAPFYKR
ncbi:MAG: hypothetical protein JSR82_10715 [Verrucomicrobia bacterium]|nr:hypothetical protein [Verrucomicrobiota bacterium]